MQTVAGVANEVGVNLGRVTNQGATLALTATTIAGVTNTQTVAGVANEVGINLGRVTNQGATLALTATTIAGVTNSVAGVTNEVGINWGRVVNPGATVSLTATTIAGVTNTQTVAGVANEVGINLGRVANQGATLALTATTIAGVTNSVAGVTNTVRADVRAWVGTQPADLTGIGYVQVDVQAIDDDATAAPNLEAFFDGTGYSATTSTIGGVANEVGVNWARVTNQTAAVNLTATTVGGVTALGTAAIWAGSIVAAAANKIADYVLRRSAATARASADGDASIFRSLLGAVSKLVNRVAETTATNLATYQEDDVTVLGNQTITTTGTAVTWTDLNTV